MNITCNVKNKYNVTASEDFAFSTLRPPICVLLSHLPQYPTCNLQKRRANAVLRISNPTCLFLVKLTRKRPKTRSQEYLSTASIFIILSLVIVQQSIQVSVF